MRHIKKYIKNERGSQLIEFLAVFPMIIFALLFIWQVALVAYAVVVSEAAARDGARVASVEGDYEAAVESSAYGLDLQSVSSSTGDSSYGKNVTVTVVTKVPTVSVPFLGKIDYDLKADATMPMEEDETDE
jgi:TadE-like protein